VDDNVPLSIFFFEAKTYVFQYNQSKQTRNIQVDSN